jgi:hypothetical protein
MIARIATAWFLSIALISVWNSLPASAQSESELAKAKEIRDKIHACYAAGKQADAVPLFKQQIAIFEKSGNDKALIALLESFGRLLKDLKRTSEYKANENRIEQLKTKRAPTTETAAVRSRFEPSKLIGRKFIGLGGERAGGYLNFVDDENVEIRSEYVRYNGVDLEGPIAATYTVLNNQIKVKYTFNGVGRVSTYSASMGKNDSVILFGGDRPLPSMVTAITP